MNNKVEMAFTVALEASRAAKATDRAKVFKDTFREVHLFLGEYIEHVDSLIKESREKERSEEVLTGR